MFNLINLETLGHFILSSDPKAPNFMEKWTDCDSWDPFRCHFWMLFLSLIPKISRQPASRQLRHPNASSKRSPTSRHPACHVSIKDLAWDGEISNEWREVDLLMIQGMWPLKLGWNQPGWKHQLLPSKWAIASSGRQITLDEHRWHPI